MSPSEIADPDDVDVLIVRDLATLLVTAPTRAQTAHLRPPAENPVATRGNMLAGYLHAIETIDETLAPGFKADLVALLSE